MVRGKLKDMLAGDEKFAACDVGLQPKQECLKCHRCHTWACTAECARAVADKSGAVTAGTQGSSHGKGDTVDCGAARSEPPLQSGVQTLVTLWPTARNRSCALLRSMHMEDWKHAREEEALSPSTCPRRELRTLAWACWPLRCRALTKLTNGTSNSCSRRRRRCHWRHQAPGAGSQAKNWRHPQETVATSRPLPGRGRFSPG